MKREVQRLVSTGKALCNNSLRVFFGGCSIIFSKEVKQMPK